MTMTIEECEVGIENNLHDRFLRRFLRDYLNRYVLLPLAFSIDKGRFQVAGRAQNNNCFFDRGTEYDLTRLLAELEVPSSITVGGDFVIGHDYGQLRDYGEVELDIGITIFDTANHGYDSLFLSSHIRSYVLNMVDSHLRRFGNVESSLFEELNDMMRGPITHDLLVNTLPLRQRSHGAAGIHGQLHTDSNDFNFFCAGLPLFYYQSARNQFFYLEPDKGPPLGYFANKEPLRKRYVPHNVQIQPGDYLIMATDGCFESELADEELDPIAVPSNPVKHYQFQSNSSLRVMSSFNEIHLELSDDYPPFNDAAVTSFCAILEPYLKRGASPERTVDEALFEIEHDRFFPRDDRSLILVRAK